MDRRKGILTRVTPDLWKALSRLALESETTLQDLCTEAFKDRLQKGVAATSASPLNFAVLHAAYGAFYSINCPEEVQKSRAKRNKWRLENPFPYDGTRWVPRYRPMLSNSAKTIRDWHISYHGDDGRQIDNDPYRNSRNRIREARVSDRSGEAAETERLGPKGESAIGAAETPALSTPPCGQPQKRGDTSEAEGN